MEAQNQVRIKRYGWLEIGAFIIVVLVFGLIATQTIAPAFWAKLFNVPVTIQTGPALAPTLTNVQRFNASVAAPATSVEQNLPQLQPSAAPVIQGGSSAPPVPVPTVAPARYSPIDLGSAPVPTPVSRLTQEQLDASAASEEQNQLNTAQSGLTDAQRMVQEHDAEWNARNP